MKSESRKSVADKVATTISVVFHPLILPVYVLLILLTAPTVISYMPVRLKLVLVGVVFVNTVLLPAMLILLLWYRNHISSLSMEKREERSVILFMTGLLYVVTAVMLWRLNLPGLIKSFVASVAFLLLIVAAVNTKYKISIHAAGAGAILAIVILFSIRLDLAFAAVIMVIILFVGLILYARLRLNAHTPNQVYLGFALGASSVTLIMSMFRYFLQGSF